MKISKLKEAFRILKKAAVSPCIAGHKGIGKTEAVRQYCQENNLNLIEVRLGQLSDAGDLIGLAEITSTEKGNRYSQFIMPKIYAQVTEDPRDFVIFFDEFNRAPKDLIQSIFELVYDGTVSANGLDIRGRGQVILAQNPDIEGYDVTSFKDDAFSDRICQIKAEATTADWLMFAKKNKVNPQIVKYIEASPDSLNKRKDSFVIQTSYSSRSWTRAGKVLELCEDTSMSRELVEGMVGEEQAIAFFNFMEKNKVITGADVLDNFAKFEKELQSACSISEQNSSLDLVATINSSLLTILEAKHEEAVKENIEKNPLTKEQANNLCAYLAILPPDMLTLMLNSLLKFRLIASPDKSFPYDKNMVMSKDFNIPGYPLTDRRVLQAKLAHVNKTLDYVLEAKLS